MKTQDVVEVEHGIEAAYYSSNGERYFPIIDCLCGYSTGRQDSWETAGALLDEHLTAREKGLTK